MTDVPEPTQPPREREKPDHPVLTGLVALVVVGLCVGALAGLGVLAATKVTGIGTASGDSTSSARESMVIPDRESTKSSPGPLISAKPNEPDSKKTQDTTISLQAGQTSVSPGGRIDLSGAYPGGTGATLKVQRFEGGSWSDFGDVSISVGADNFTTWIVTSNTGRARFRVYDASADLASNEVVVAIG